MGAIVALVSAFGTMAWVTPASAALSKKAREAARLGATSDGASRVGVKAPHPFGPGQHGPLLGHLPPVQQNLELVGRLKPTSRGPLAEGQIADVAVHKGFAYLNSWDNTACEDGGTFVIDVRNPSQPREVAFIPADQPFYHGEGAHSVTIDTPQFRGDLLAVNNETYGSNVPAPCAPANKTRGGFDLYDVSDPTNPRVLVRNAGDRSGERSETQNPNQPFGNSYHSVFVWQDGARAYLVGSDNVELSDVDIWDITNPRNPQWIRDFDIEELGPEQFSKIVSQSALGNDVFHHDVVVKQIAGRQRMLVSYWDGGYVQLDVTNPANPTYITDTNYDEPDPLTGHDPPEGNAHQAEYSHDNQFFLAADEDFDPFRLVSRITQAPFAGVNFAAALSAAEPITGGARIAGDTVFVGSGCPGTVPAPPPGVTIAVAERGGCSFQQKADAIEAAGYDLGIVFNNDFGPGGGRCESLINMSIDPASVDIPMAFVGRADGLRILGVFNQATYRCTGAATPTDGDTQAPPVGTGGLTVEFASQHDGWGYAHLYDANTSQEIDAFAIPESLDQSFASGFGDLSIHEFATDPATNLAYASYYSGGMRVLRFSRAKGLEQTGAWIDSQGSNFWGVEQFTTARGERLIAGSDRDFGLVILRYTGPGAITGYGGPPAVGSRPPSPRPTARRRPSNRFSLRVGRYRNGKLPLIARVGAKGRFAAALRVQRGSGRSRLVRVARKSVSVGKAGRVRLTLKLSRKAQRRVRSALAASRRGRIKGSVSAAFKPTGGTKRTVKRRIAIRR